MPPIVVTGRDDRVTQRQKQHAEEKFRKLEKYFAGILKIEATLSHGSTHGAGEAEVELLVSVRGGKPIICRSRSKELYAAVDMVLDKAESQLTRYKEKLKARKAAAQRPASGALPAGAAPDSGENEAYQDIVEKRDFS